MTGWAAPLSTATLERIYTATTDTLTATEAKSEMDYRDDRAYFLGPVSFEPFLLGRAAR